jgi:Flp pilus assembly pilin Flp
MERIQLLMGRLMTVKLADLRGEDGQGVTEYGIVLAFVAVALAAVLVVLGTGITGFINKIVTDLGNLA